MQQLKWPFCAAEIPSGSTVVLLNPESVKDIWAMERRGGFAIFTKDGETLEYHEDSRIIAGVVHTRNPE